MKNAVCAHPIFKALAFKDQEKDASCGVRIWYQWTFCSIIWAQKVPGQQKCIELLLVCEWGKKQDGAEKAGFFLMNSA